MVQHESRIDSRIEVRPARPAEYERTGEVTERAYRGFAPPEMPEWQRYLRRIADVAARAERTVVLLALLDGVIAGSATVELDHHVEADWLDPIAPDQAHLRMLGVEPSLRRRGAGRALVQASIDLARRHGRARLTLETTEAMRAAQAMYESMGFVPLGRREVRPGLAFLTYELQLQPPAATP